MGVRLRELDRSDLAAVNRWRNDADVVRHLGANFHFIGPQVDGAWFDAYLANRDRAVRLAIEDADGGALIGCVYLVDIHRVNRSAEFAIMLGEKDRWSKGLGTEAARRVLAHGFDDLNLHRIHLTVLADNVRAVHVYEKLGFQTEGRQRAAVFKGGRYHDVLLMALLAQDYRAGRG